VLIASPADSAAGTRSVLLNGSLAPAPFELRVGVPHRLRLINITTARSGMRMELHQGSEVMSWRVIAKDGAEIPPARRESRPARLPISIGETFDVEVLPTGPGELRLEARTAGGVLLGVIPVRVRE
jgi:FtsP/CotA-like multicopper oxidase with cupredoxin domain